MDLAALQVLPGSKPKRQILHPKRTKGGRVPNEVACDELHQLFHLPMEAAAAQLGVGLTVLKQICRKYGIVRWPFRKVLQLKRLASIVKDAQSLVPIIKDMQVPLDSKLWAQFEGKSRDKIQKALSIMEASMPPPAKRPADADGIGGSSAAAAELGAALAGHGLAAGLAGGGGGSPTSTLDALLLQHPSPPMSEGAGALDFDDESTVSILTAAGIGPELMASMQSMMMSSNALGPLSTNPGAGAAGLGSAADAAPGLGAAAGLNPAAMLGSVGGPLHAPALTHAGGAGAGRLLRVDAPSGGAAAAAAAALDVKSGGGGSGSGSPLWQQILSMASAAASNGSGSSDDGGSPVPMSKVPQDHLLSLDPAALGPAHHHHHGGSPPLGDHHPLSASFGVSTPLGHHHHHNLHHHHHHASTPGLAASLLPSDLVAPSPQQQRGQRQAASHRQAAIMEAHLHHHATMQGLNAANAMVPLGSAVGDLGMVGSQQSQQRTQQQAQPQRASAQQQLQRWMAQQERLAAFDSLAAFGE